jgi:hypothetical protein
MNVLLQWGCENYTGEERGGGRGEGQRVNIEKSGEGEGGWLRRRLGGGGGGGV